MKLRHVFASVYLAFAWSANAQTFELKQPPHFPLRPPSERADQTIIDAHREFVCWVEGVRTMTPKYHNGILSRIDMKIENPSCDIPARTLTFIYVSGNTFYRVLKLESPRLSDTAIGGYPDAELDLSVQDATEKPLSSGSYEGLYEFRMILRHRYAYDPNEYGQTLANFETLHRWNEISTVLLSQQVVEQPAGCDPRFPQIPCTFLVSRYRRTSENSFNSKRYSWEWEQWDRN